MSKVNHFGLLVLAFSVISVFADVNIDCGSSDPAYTDGNSIVWVGDNDQNGLTRTVQPANSVSDVMDTLRVFSDRKKNCYTADVDAGGQILVRATFHYGNYDGRSSPPTFDLQFDGNEWATVETSADGPVYYEAIYVSKGARTGICVAQTKSDQFPFISALEVRSLGSHMYSHVGSNYALFLKNRVAYGSSETIRYIDDAYDRIWSPAVVGNELVKVTSDATFIDVNIDDNPPEKVMQNAITTSTTSDSIVLSTEIPTGVSATIYLNMYFSEVTNLDSTQNRSFRVYKDDQPFSNPIIPPYGSVDELCISNLTISSNTNFSLVATSDSTLPPLINAIELFYISKELTDGTNSNDVEALGLLQNQFEVLQEWGGDPCLPTPYTWDWLNCSDDATPRVTALYLSSFGLSGTLVDFSSMTALETIDLHNNSLNGAIPDFLGNIPSLRRLNLADNEFSGPLPASLTQNNNLKLVVTGNPDLCTSGKPCQVTDTPADSSESSAGDFSGGKGTTKRKMKKTKLPAILGSTIPSFFVVWVGGFLAFLHRKRKRAAISAGGRPNGNGNGKTQPTGVIAQMTGKIGQTVIDEIKVNIEEEVNVEFTSQTLPETNDGEFDH